MTSSTEKFPIEVKGDADLGRKEVHAFIRGQITTAFTPALKQAYAGPAPTVPLEFTKLLGTDDSAHWWRLYINPKDWNAAKAWAASKHNDVALERKKPGYYYNYDDYDNLRPGAELKNFHDPIVKAYTDYFVKDIRKEYFGPNATKRFGPDDYYALWTAAKPDDPTGEKFARKTGVGGRFGGAAELASEVYAVEFDIGDPAGKWHLACESDEDATTIPRAFLVHWKDDLSQNPYGAPNQLTPGIKLVFDNFYDGMKTAKTQEAQLRQIASVIRSLHMFHAFSDGCGRCNVFTLLPLLLMKYGYGLPLGGKNGRGISRTALHMLFNGGYSLDEIAKYLFLSQDRGLLDPDSIVHEK